MWIVFFLWSLFLSGTVASALDHEDEPVHQPWCPEFAHHYSGCSPDYDTVMPDGTCRGCGARACPTCGCERCECKDPDEPV